VGLIVPPRDQLSELMDKAENMPNLTLDDLK
jgi:phosphate transport system substrate-binding protein